MSAKKRDESSRKSGFSAFKLFLVVLVLVLIPTTMDQLASNPETVRDVGRVAIGIALLVFLYGLVSKTIKLLAFVLLALIVVAALASENVIELPRLLPQ